MKKILVLALAGVLAMGLLAGCGEKKAAEGDGVELTPIVVGASTTPHGEILAAVKEQMAAEGYDLQIKEFNDYVQPNLALNDGELDANYFQHQPYMEKFNAEHQTDLVAVAAIHYEPLGLYPGQKKSIDELADGDMIAVPSDATNEARALLLLQDQGIIVLKKDAGVFATPKDIVENPKNLVFKELGAEQVAKALPDVAMGVINGNNALLDGLNVSQDAIAMEEKDSLAADTYANILAAKKGDEKRPEIQALAKALSTQTVKDFINEKYEGAVVTVF